MIQSVYVLTQNLKAVFVTLTVVSDVRRLHALGKRYLSIAGGGHQIGVPQSGFYRNALRRVESDHLPQGVSPVRVCRRAAGCQSIGALARGAAAFWSAPLQQRAGLLRHPGALVRAREADEVDHLLELVVAVLS